MTRSVVVFPMCAYLSASQVAHFLYNLKFFLTTVVLLIIKLSNKSSHGFIIFYNILDLSEHTGKQLGTVGTLKARLALDLSTISACGQIYPQ